tara:strand:- start:6642 stop:8432 length:1791 start_codon:yes stop_codon:yes gene_type:complete
MFLKIIFDASKELKTLLSESKKKKILIPAFFLIIILLSLAETSVIGSLYPLFDFLGSANENQKYLNYINEFFETNLTFDKFKLLFFIIFGSLFILSALLQIISFFISGYLREEIEFSLKKKIMNNYLEKNFEFFDQAKSGDLTQKILVQTRESVSMIFEIGNILRELCIVIAIYFFLFFISVKYTLILTLFLFVLFFLTILTGKKIIVKKTNIRHHFQEKIFSLVSVIFSAFKIIKINKKENFFKKQFLNFAYHFRNNEIIIQSILNIPSVVIRSLTFFIIIFLVYYLSENINNFQNYLPTIIVYLAAVYKINNSFGSINNATLAVSRLLPSLKIVLDEAVNKEKEVYIDNNNKIYNYFDKIEFKNFKYFYKKNFRSGIHDINFSIKKKSINLIIGPSGCGKSTLADLIAGFKKPQEGTIVIDGKKNIESYNYEVTDISYADQNNHLFPGTIKENISIFEEKIDKDKLSKVIDICCLDDFLKEQKNGIDQTLNEKGSNISGGQKQRIGLARTLYQNKDIILLDESLSNLEKNLERIIIKNLFEFVKKEKKTLIIISHSLKNLNDADQIIIMKDGTISEIGDHKELIQKSDFYKSSM